VAAKRRILECQSSDDVAVLNASDAWIRGAEYGAGSGRRVWFDGVNPVFPESWDIDGSCLPLRGVHQRANALAAGLLASDWGVGSVAIRSALESFEPVAHRMEVVGHFEGIEWINNSMCTNVAAVDASFAALAAPAVAIVGGRSKETDLPALAQVLARRSRACVVIGEVAVELAGMLDQLGHAARIAGSMDDAVAMAGELARRGDVVVLSPGCSSFDMFSGFEERGRAFRNAVARWSAR
jgi:UDP-N-acetylmuramoylalanine--D-glutamate ligase